MLEVLEATKKILSQCQWFRIHDITFNLQVAQNRSFWKTENALSRIFCSPKLSTERWILHCLCETFPEDPPYITIGIWIIVYLIPKHFSCFKNYKLYWFSNLFLALLLLVPKNRHFCCQGSTAYDEDGS